jgi:hypothetical protein
MNGEPSNRASDEARRRFDALRRIGDMTVDELDEFRGYFADDFVREDRRRVVTLPSLGLDDFLESVRAYWEIGGGVPIFSVAEVIDVRGEHLVLLRARVEFSDGTATEFLSVDEYDEQMRTKRVISFDVDDVAGAHAELDRRRALA